MTFASQHLALAGCLLASCLAHSRSAADSRFYWYYYDVDTTGKVEGYSSIKVDSKGKIKLGYRGHDDVKFAEFDGQRWKVERADTATYAGAKVEMTLDSKDRPHILFENWSNKKIAHAWHDGTKWNMHQVIAYTYIDNADYYQLAIRANKNDELHMSYVTADTVGANVTWSRMDKDGKITDSMSIAKRGRTGKWNSLAFDSKGQPFVAYWAFVRSNLVIAYRDGSEWKDVVIDSGDYDRSQGFYPWIENEPGTDNFFVAFYSEALKTIRLAHGNPKDGWKLSTVDTLVPHSTFSTTNPIAVDSKARLYMARVNAEIKEDKATKSQLVLSYRLKDSTWTHEVVDSNGIAGEYASIALLEDSLPVISYFERGKKTMRVAIASMTAPADTNNNGTPDYKELPASIRGKSSLRPRTGAKNIPEIDALGKRHDKALIGPNSKPVRTATPRFISPKTDR